MREQPGKPSEGQFLGELGRMGRISRVPTVKDLAGKVIEVPGIEAAIRAARLKTCLRARVKTAGTANFKS
jgi:hypothetical protein